MLTGLVVFISVAVLIGLLNFLINAKGEGARRVKLVLGGTVALAVSGMVLEGGGPLLLAALIAVVAAITWVVRGFMKR